jgi:hypothetical protein
VQVERPRLELPDTVAHVDDVDVRVQPLECSTMDRAPAPPVIMESLVMMNPAEIRFTQSSIEPQFSQGARMPMQGAKLNSSGAVASVPASESQDTTDHEMQKPETPSGSSTYAAALRMSKGQPLSEVLDLLRGGSMKVTDLPPIRVAFHDGKWWSLDNRRLWLFKQLGCLIPVQKVEGHNLKELFQKMTTRADGLVVAFNTKKSRQEVRSAEKLKGHVLKWSLENICQERLHANKVCPPELSC